MDQIATQSNDGRDHQTSNTLLWQQKCYKHTKEYVMHTKTKKIAIEYHYLRELVQDKKVKMGYVNTKE